ETDDFILDASQNDDGQVRGFGARTEESVAPGNVGKGQIEQEDVVGIFAQGLDGFGEGLDVSEAELAEVVLREGLLQKDGIGRAVLDKQNFDGLGDHEGGWRSGGVRSLVSIFSPKNPGFMT